MTIGQYLQPSKKHHPVMSFVTPEEFKSYETVGLAKGFLLVAASPLTRSSTMPATTSQDCAPRARRS